MKMQNSDDYVIFIRKSEKPGYATIREPGRPASRSDVHYTHLRAENKHDEALARDVPRVDCARALSPNRLRALLR